MKDRKTRVQLAIDPDLFEEYERMADERGLDLRALMVAALRVGMVALKREWPTVIDVADSVK